MANFFSLALSMCVVGELSQEPKVHPHDGIGQRGLQPSKRGRPTQMVCVCVANAGGVPMMPKEEKTGGYY